MHQQSIVCTHHVFNVHFSATREENLEVLLLRLLDLGRILWKWILLMLFHMTLQKSINP